MDWASFPKTSSAENNNGDANVISEMNPSYVVQIVRQVNYGPLESKRYFIAVREKADEPFLEVTERDLIIFFRIHQAKFVDFLEKEVNMEARNYWRASRLWGGGIMTSVTHNLVVLVLPQRRRQGMAKLGDAEAGH